MRVPESYAELSRGRVLLMDGLTKAEVANCVGIVGTSFDILCECFQRFMNFCRAIAHRCIFS